MLYANVAAEKLLGFSREEKVAALWDENNGHVTADESGGIGDSATVVSLSRRRGSGRRQQRGVESV